MLPARSAPCASDAPVPRRRDFAALLSRLTPCASESLALPEVTRLRSVLSEVITTYAFRGFLTNRSRAARRWACFAITRGRRCCASTHTQQRSRALARIHNSRHGREGREPHSRMRGLRPCACASQRSQTIQWDELAPPCAERVGHAWAPVLAREPAQSD